MQQVPPDMYLLDDAAALEDARDPDIRETRTPFSCHIIPYHLFIHQQITEKPHNIYWLSN
jgi:hypothetical protein